MKLSIHEREAKGQALIEFALISGVLFSVLFIIFEAGRIFQAWQTIQNSAREGVRYALTGQSYPNGDFDNWWCPLYGGFTDEWRVCSIKDEALGAATGLDINPSATPNDPGYFFVAVCTPSLSCDPDDPSFREVAGPPGEPTRVLVTYNAAIVTPFFQPIARFIRLSTEIEAITEAYNQVSPAEPPDVRPISPSTGTTPTIAETDLIITKTATIIEKPPGCSDCTYAGEPINYSLEVKNLGPFNAPSPVVVDILPLADLPKGTTFITATVSQNGSPMTGANCIYEAPEVNCKIPFLSASDGSNTALIEIETIAPIVAPGNSALNHSEVFPSPVTIDPDLTNNVSDYPFSVVPWSVLKIEKIDSIDPVQGFDPITYGITLTNEGLNDATDVIVTDTMSDLPFGMKFNFIGFSSDNPDVNCKTPPGFQNQVVCELAKLPAFQTVNISLNFIAPDILQPASQPINNTVQVTSTETDRGRGDLIDSETTWVTPRIADVSVMKSAPQFVNVGTVFDYIITLTNLNGAQRVPASDVLMTDKYDGRLEILSIAPSVAATCNDDNSGTILCQFDNPINVGESINVTIRAKSDISGDYVNKASATAHEYDPNINNNNDDKTDPNARTLTVITGPDLSIEKFAPDQADINSEFDYEVKVFNQGPPIDANNISIIDRLPEDLTFVSVSGCDSDVYDSLTREVRCDIDFLQQNDHKHVYITVKANKVGQVFNQAEVLSSQYEPNIGNNTSGQVSTEIIAKTNLAINKEGPLTVIGGTSFVYSVTITNTETITASNVSVVDHLPGEVQFDPTSTIKSGCQTIQIYSIDGKAHIQCGIGTVLPGDSVTVYFAAITNGINADTVVANFASVSGDIIDSNPLDDTDIVNTTILTPP